MFNNEKYNFKKRVMHDAWSDLVGGAFSSVGISPELRDVLQPAINKASDSLLPPGGAIPITGAGADADAKPQPTGFKFQSNINPNTFLIGGLVIGIAAYWLIARK